MELVIKQPLPLPLWLLYLSVFAALLVTLFQVLRFAYTILFKRPELEVKLTREVFFRLVFGTGECVFTNAVLLAKKGEIEIRDITFFLEKVDGATKKYQLDIDNIGKKVDSPNTPIALHSFYTKSPISYITPNTVERPVYLTKVSGYGEKMDDALKKLNEELSEYRQQLLSKIGDVSQNQDKYIVEMQEAISGINKKTLESLTQAIQLEEGEYKLTINVKYKPLHWTNKISPLSEKRSSISFTVDDYKTDFMKQAELWLDVYARNTVLATTANPLPDNPSYTPKNIKEV